MAKNMHSKPKIMYYASPIPKKDSEILMPAPQPTEYQQDLTGIFRIPLGMPRSVKQNNATTTYRIPLGMPRSVTQNNATTTPASR